MVCMESRLIGLLKDKRECKGGHDSRQRNRRIDSYKHRHKTRRSDIISYLRDSTIMSHGQIQNEWTMISVHHAARFSNLKFVQLLTIGLEINQVTWLASPRSEAQAHVCLPVHGHILWSRIDHTNYKSCTHWHTVMSIYNQFIFCTRLTAALPVWCLRDWSNISLTAETWPER